MFELHTDDNKSKYSSNCKDIIKSAKKFYEKLYTKETASKADTTECLRKTLNRKKISTEKLNLCEAKIIDEIMKFINPKTNDKFQVTIALNQIFITTFQMN